ncbi:MAG TPA: hypothetical protein VMZ69_05750 [Saprospiraceae bacterium]|nr:hypothetical protein [Saprospiraceae bacterium]
MKEIYLIYFFTLSTAMSFSQNIAIQEVLYNQSLGNDKFELINTSNTTINISSWWMCSRFGYRQFGSASDIQVLQGNLVMAPGASIKMRLINLNLHDTHSDFGIFTDTNFGSPSSMQDFIQWGNSADVGRGYVAVEKGIWRDMNPPNIQLDFIPTATSGFSANWSGVNSGGGELTFSTDFTNASPTLPIQLLTLSGKVNMSKKVELKWHTLDEFNIEKYIVENSLDGHVFTSIAEIPSQNFGSSQGEYFFTDESPVINVLTQYRIRQIDADGGEIISSSLYLKVKDVNDHRIFISPMPISGIGCFSMELYWPKEVSLVKFRIMDMTGRVADEFSEPLLEGYNNVMHQFYGIEPGQYIMVLSDDEGDYSAQYFLIGK